MITPDVYDIERVMREKGYKVFSSYLSINIVGIRVNKSTNKFNDTLCVFWNDYQGNRVIKYFPCTTKPGKHWLSNPLNSKGTAILIPNQYIGVFKRGFHNRSRPSKKYKALEQILPMEYIRDNTKDANHDYSGKGVTKRFWANIKSNIHRAAKSGWSTFVDKWSAACQVITGTNKAGNSNWDEFMGIVDRSAMKYGDVFSYTLLEDKDFE